MRGHSGADWWTTTRQNHQIADEYGGSAASVFLWRWRPSARRWAKSLISRGRVYLFIRRAIWEQIFCAHAKSVQRALIALFGVAAFDPVPALAKQVVNALVKQPIWPRPSGRALNRRACRRGHAELAVKTNSRSRRQALGLTAVPGDNPCGVFCRKGFNDPRVRPKCCRQNQVEHPVSCCDQRCFGMRNCIVRVGKSKNPICSHENFVWRHPLIYSAHHLYLSFSFSEGFFWRELFSCRARSEQRDSKKNGNCYFSHYPFLFPRLIRRFSPLVSNKNCQTCSFLMNTNCSPNLP